MATVGSNLGVRVPRFQRTKRKQAAVRKIEFTPLAPGMAAKCADNLSILHYILINDHHHKGLHKYRASPPSSKLRMPEPDYLTRRVFHNVFTKTGYDPGTGSMSLYFLYLYLRDNPINPIPAANLVAAALIVANKVFDDRCLKVRAWSNICQIPSSRLAEAELALLDGLGWKLAVSKEDYYWWGNVMHALMQRVTR